MEKWLLLAVTLGAVYGAVESIRWLFLMQKTSTREIEKFAGYEGSRLPEPMREMSANRLRFGLRGLPMVTIILVGLAAAMVIATVRAFLAP